MSCIVIYHHFHYHNQDYYRKHYHVTMRVSRVHTDFPTPPLSEWVSWVHTDFSTPPPSFPIFIINATRGFAWVQMEGFKVNGWPFPTRVAVINGWDKTRSKILAREIEMFCFIVIFLCIRDITQLVRYEFPYLLSLKLYTVPLAVNIDHKKESWEAFFVLKALIDLLWCLQLSQISIGYNLTSFLWKVYLSLHWTGNL